MSTLQDTRAACGAESRAQALMDEAVAAAQSGARGFGHGAHPLGDGAVLALPRHAGDSRRPYGADGSTFWIHASGYMHGNEGLFSVFPRRSEGQEPSIAFIARRRHGDGAILHPIAGVPDFGHEPEFRAVVFGRACAWHLLRADAFDYALRVHADSATRVAFTMLLRNTSGEPAEVEAFAFLNPLLRHQLFDTDEDRWFKKCVVHRGQTGEAAFVLDVNEDKDRFSSTTNRMVVRRRVDDRGGVRLMGTEETPSRLQFLGSIHHHLLQAASLRAGAFGEPMRTSGFRENAIAGDLVRLRLDPGAWARMDWFASAEQDAGDDAPADPLALAIEPPDDLDERIRRLEEAKAEAARDFSFAPGPLADDAPIPASTIEPGILSGFVEHLKEQVEFCALIKGYVQLSENSLVGVRDVFQALEGLLLWQPAAARAKMLEALSYTLADGRCPRQYSLPRRDGSPGRADLRPFIDQGVWVVDAFASYLRATGDMEILDEIVGFHEIVDEAAGRIRPSSESSSVLDHLRRIVGHLLRNRAESTGCLRALYGDWNDALDGLGTLPGGQPGYGDGASVMASLQLLRNLDDLADMLAACGKALSGELDGLRADRDALAEALQRHAVVRSGQGARILHGWGHGRSYTVGGFKDPDGVARDSSTSNAFWVLSGLLRETPELRPAVLDAFQRLDSKFGIRTFAPHFPPGTPGVGRIGKLPSGTAENGAVYVHATAFAIMALFEMGEAELAWHQIARILPFTPLHERLSHSPFVLPNSYSSNPALGLDGESMNDWQTGSSNVLLKAIARCVVGFRPGFGVLRIAPAAWCPFASWTALLPWRGRPVRIAYESGNGAGRRFIVDGRPAEGRRDDALETEALEIAAETLPQGRELRVHIIG